MFPLSSGQWTRHHQRRKGAWQLRALALAAVSPKKTSQAGCQTCHSADMVLASDDVQFQTINAGKDLFRQRGCIGCHRYEGYDKEPEDLNSVGQQIKQIETQKKDNIKQTSRLDEAG